MKVLSMRLVAAHIALFCLTLTTNAYAVGEWHFYANYSTYSDIEQFDGQLYIVASSHLYTCEATATGDISTLSRLDGLSGTNVQTIKTCPDAGVMAIVYTDGDIDILGHNGELRNVPDYRNLATAADKTIRHVTAHADHLLLATGFGLVVVNVVSGVVERSYQPSTAITLAFEWDGYTYYSTASATYRCAASDNFYSPSSWTEWQPKALLDVAYTDDGQTRRCWLLWEDGSLNDCSAGATTSVTTANAAGIEAGTHGLLLIDGTLGLVTTMTDATTRTSAIYCSDAVQTTDSLLFAVHPTDGLMVIAVTDDADDTVDPLSVVQTSRLTQQTGSDLMGDIAQAGGQLVAINSGGLRAQYGEVYRRAGVVARFDGATWSHLSQDDVESQLPDGDNGHFRGLTCVAIDPTQTSRYYVGTLEDGVWAFDGDSLVAHYDDETSDLTAYDANGEVRIEGITVDDDGRVWATNSVCTDILWSLSDGVWQSHPMAAIAGEKGYTSVLRARNEGHHLVWLASTELWNRCKVAIYYPDDAQISTFSILTDQDGSELQPGHFNYIAEDANGAIWLLTSSGPFVIDSQTATFNEPGLVRRPKIPRGDGTNLADYLMAGVNTLCMAVDAANRKWIGTLSDGLYLLSADGLTQLAHYTMQNSPLPSDAIIALAIDAESGTLYISTDGGITTLATDAVAGADTYASAHCYPNPVRPDYTGSLHIVGLKDRTKVRVCDTANHVVWQTTSAGGMASWDLTNADGRRVRAGVYLVYGIDASGKSGCVTKVLVVD